MLNILPLLRCPVSHESLLANNLGLVSEVSGCSFPVIRGRPVFLPPEVRENLVIKEDHVSNTLSKDITAKINDTAGLVLNLSAGGTPVKSDNTIEVEYSIFRHTDIVADAHNLPFKDSVFSGIVCMNAFEHYRKPHLVAKELYRILKPNGWLLVHTAFIQPVHEAPYHFFNCTKYGLGEWFHDFQDVTIDVSANFNPIYALSWLLSELDLSCNAFGGAEASEAFQKLSVAEIISFWRDSPSRDNVKWDLLKNLPQAAQEMLAAGYQLTATKR
jgi:SAM-dependent methyltransferase/uncharacterized protein YbaR (Trm112 family)